MSLIEVKSILGEPDEIRLLYGSSTGNEKPVGYTYWYIIRRAVKNGSVNEKQEVLVRVSFDRKGLVTKVDHWGFDAANPSFNRTPGGAHQFEP